MTSVIDLHFLTLLEMTSGTVSARTGSVLETASASQTDIAAVSLQLLVELSQRHSGVASLMLELHVSVCALDGGQHHSVLCAVAR